MTTHKLADMGWLVVLARLVIVPEQLLVDAP
jgi:hypothetical protein